MPIFEYQARDERGQDVRGTLHSSSLSAAAEDLAKRGFEVEHVGIAQGLDDPVPREFAGRSEAASPPETPARERSPSVQPEIDRTTQQRSYMQTHVVGQLVGRVPLAQQLFFFRQLGTMLNAGVSIIQSLDTLAGQARDPRLARIVRELAHHAREGRPLSVGMQRYPEVFSPLMLSLIRAGEEGGMLEGSVKQIAEYLEREIELRNLMRRVTIYPKLVVGASIVIVLATNSIIASLGKSGGLSSPLTQPATWFVLGPLLVAIYLFVRLGLPNPRIKYNYDQVVLSIPGLGNTVKQLCMAKFGRAFGALYSGGVPVPKATQLAADACGNEYLRARIYPAAKRLEEGSGITETFRATGAFSPIVLDMTHTGETTGNLDAMLQKMAEFYEDEAQTRSVQFAYAFGILALLLVAAYVGYVVVTFYVGYFSGITKAAG
ncbi:MAG: type II secretion system F family protein [Fimbriimonadaceae bacterium]|nr:type II secretion system F family protein [Chthonomonadaceae bacterium]MCO5295812.1 type II secretion system F family protein [Fimbriimonadaceae bacterium]